MTLLGVIVQSFIHGLIEKRKYIQEVVKADKLMRCFLRQLFVSLLGQFSNYKTWKTEERTACDTTAERIQNPKEVYV